MTAIESARETLSFIEAVQGVTNLVAGLLSAVFLFQGLRDMLRRKRSPVPIEWVRDGVPFPDLAEVKHHQCFVARASHCALCDRPLAPNARRNFCSDECENQARCFVGDW